MYSTPYFWVDQNILGPIISDIRGSAVNSYTGPPCKTLAVDRTQVSNPWPRTNSPDLLTLY